MAPPGRATRPTSDRVREAAFSMLEAWVVSREPWCGTCSPAAGPWGSRRSLVGRPTPLSSSRRKVRARPRGPTWPRWVMVPDEPPSCALTCSRGWPRRPGPQFSHQFSLPFGNRWDHSRSRRRRPPNRKDLWGRPRGRPGCRPGHGRPALRVARLGLVAGQFGPVPPLVVAETGDDLVLPAGWGRCGRSVRGYGCYAGASEPER